MASLPQRRPRSHKSIFLRYDELCSVSFEINAVTRNDPLESVPCGTRARTQLAHRSHPSPGGRSWHVYHNGGPGLSYPLSLVVVDHTASSIRTTHKAASGFIYPFERGLIFVHAQRAIEACSVWFAHTRVYPTLRAIVAQYYMLYTICYSSLTDSANTTSNIAIPYDSAFS